MNSPKTTLYFDRNLESAPPTQPTTTVEIVHPAAADESDAGQDITFDDGRYSADTEGSNSESFKCLDYFTTGLNNYWSKKNMLQLMVAWLNFS